MDAGSAPASPNRCAAAARKGLISHTKKMSLRALAPAFFIY
jgi:hypothetical protein